MESFNTICPYCNHAATIKEDNFSSNSHYFEKGNKEGLLELYSEIIVCPNTECKEYILSCFVFKAKPYRDNYSNLKYSRQGGYIQQWKLKPQSAAKPFPNYIPQAIINDYEEACLIKDLSPKASATLSRRCLQGMIRDFWKEVNGTLANQIKNIETKIDPVTWNAIDAVRKIGNIGAHMEKDINLIVDVEPHEAELLISLIETLIEEWYINTHQREEKMKAITQLAQKKDIEKKQTTQNIS